jgi:16S rRNA (guanine527-N7)-methyltransferase
LLDTNQKKTAFLRQVKAELKLNNLDVVTSRIEDWHAPTGFTQIISRAFASLSDFVSSTAHLSAPGARWLAMKGLDPRAEVAQLPPGFVLNQNHKLSVPGLDAERHLLVLSRA